MKWLRDYFSFSKPQRNGIVVLLFIILLLLITKFVINIRTKPEIIVNKEFEDKILAFEKTLKKQNILPENRLNKYIIARYDTLELFDFDPNNTTREQWKQLGLTDKQIATITNYTNKGGNFYNKEDFKKIYGIRTKQFELLKPYIKIEKRYSKKPDSYKKEWSQDMIIDLFLFNPNSATKTEFKKLGFTQKQIKTLLNYRLKGGRFFKKEDLKKIHGITSKQYYILEPYIEIQNEIKERSAEEPLMIELNSASAEQLVKLKGIGQTYAKRIIKYRKLLGGFARTEQLTEVYGITKETFNTIKNKIEVDHAKIKTININFASKQELSKHIYISYKTAEKIVNYRTKNGSFSTIEELKQKNILPKSEYKKLTDYLTVK